MKHYPAPYIVLVCDNTAIHRGGWMRDMCGDAVRISSVALGSKFELLLGFINL